jgi:hypothetical protein
MEIKLAATMRVAHVPQKAVGHAVPVPPVLDETLPPPKLNPPLRPTRPVIEFLSMTALERTMWEIRARSATALHAQTQSLIGDDVEALIAG